MALPPPSLPPHLFASESGELFDTRDPEWSKKPPLRRLYRATHGGKGFSLGEVKAALRAGPYAWPGGYPLYFVTRDNAALSFEAVRERWEEVVSDFLADDSSGWRVETVAINYEDAALRCDHTGRLIPSAYGEDE